MSSTGRGRYGVAIVTPDQCRAQLRWVLASRRKASRLFGASRTPIPAARVMRESKQATKSSRPTSETTAWTIPRTQVIRVSLTSRPKTPL